MLSSFLDKIQIAGTAQKSVFAMSVISIFFVSISVADTLIFPDEYADLQTAMDFAAVGDSILVKAGTFSIADIEVKSGVTIFGESGNPQDVVLISDSGTHFFSMINADSTTTISNITFMVESYSISLQFSDPTFQNCIFTRGPAGAGLAFVIEGSSPVFEQCRAHSFEYGLFRIKRSSMLFTIVHSMTMTWLWKPLARHPSPTLKIPMLSL